MKRLILALLILSGLCASAQENPKADEKAVVCTGNARFTVLTPRLIRMEWSEDSRFEDRATLTFVNRSLPVPKFTVKDSRSKVTIKTEALTVTYHKNGRFSPSNLSAEFLMNGKKTVWHYGDRDTLNLKGTARTLDGNYGSTLKKGETICDGVASRSGWAVIDDSKRHLLSPTSSHWKVWVESRPEKDYSDIYLFAYGHDYTTAVKDYIRIAGAIPLPPKYAFGYWWSRYWQYSDNELMELVGQIKGFDIPIDVLIVDMDWHETWSLKKKDAPKDEYGQRIGWTGYTWKEQLFPNPKNFLTWCHRERLRTSLNLHPASGIQPYEEPYKRFTEAYGVPADGRSVPFHIDEEKWADAYFSTVLDPMVRDGVDFWWLDWQQWKESKWTKDLSNTFWLNHTFCQHMAESSGLRPMIHHRWGGLGSHRYQVGFSGDTQIGWPTLRFQPWFTATASNVGYGYWGHDIGGHFFRKGDPHVTDPELYLRWLQYSVFTPIFKTHCTKDGSIERRIWMFPDHMFYMRDAIRLRYDLAPYIYSCAWQAASEGICICRPLYYYWPEKDEAYDFREEFMYGNDFLCTVVGEPADKVTGLAGRDMWFPEGTWYDCSTGEMIKGESKMKFGYTIAENPRYARAGAVIPMNPKSVKNLQDPCDELVVTLYPGADGSTVLYEDDGMTTRYNSEHATTAISCTRVGNTLRAVVSAREGSYAGMPSSRKYTFRLPGRFPPQRVLINGQEAGYSRFAEEGEWTYDGMSLAVEIRTGLCDCSADTSVELFFDGKDLDEESMLWGLEGKFRRFAVLTPEFKAVFAASFDSSRQLPASYLFASQTPNYITENPSKIREYIARFREKLPLIAKEMEEKGYADSGFIKRFRAQITENN